MGGIFVYSGFWEGGSFCFTRVFVLIFPKGSCVSIPTLYSYLMGKTVRVTQLCVFRNKITENYGREFE